MISKQATASSFFHTCRYVCIKQGAEVLLSEGVRTHDYKLMGADFLAQQELRPQKEHACMHAILSFYPGEKPTDELMKEIAAKYLKELGIVDTQYAVTKHTDKAHPHMHIVANMVNNQGKAISDSWIGYKGKKAAQRLTQEYNLTPALEKNLKMTNLEALSHTEAQKYKVYIAISELLPGCKTMDDLERKLAEQKITVQYKLNRKTEEREGISFKTGDISFKGSQVDRKFSYAGLENRLSINRSQAVKQQENQRPSQQLSLQELYMQHQQNKRVAQRDQANKVTQGEHLNHGKHSENLLETLLKPLPQEENIPYQFIKRKKEEENKKRSHGLHR